VLAPALLKLRTYLQYVVDVSHQVRYFLLSHIKSQKITSQQKKQLCTLRHNNMLMQSCTLHPLLVLALTIRHLALLRSAGAFSPSRLGCLRPSATIPWMYHTTISTRLKSGAADESNGERDSDGISQRDSSRSVPNDIGLEIIRGSDSEISDEMWGDLEGAAPSRWMAMKGVSAIRYSKWKMVEDVHFFALCFSSYSYKTFNLFHHQTTAARGQYLHIRSCSFNCLLPGSKCSIWTWMAGAKFGLLASLSCARRGRVSSW